MAHIGIKLADGSFYPVIDEASTVRKAMVVTTVKDKQPSVRINLYKSDSANGDSGLLQVGTLMVENLPSLPKGGPDVELELGLEEGGMLNVIARERTSGSEQSLTVSLDNLPPADSEELPDFELSGHGDSEEPPITLVTDELTGDTSDFSIDNDFSLDDDLSSLDDDLPSLEEAQSEPAEEAASPELDDFSMDEDFDIPESPSGDNALSFDDELVIPDEATSQPEEELLILDETPDQESLSDDFTAPDDFPSLDDESEFAVSDADGMDTTPYNSNDTAMSTDGLDDEFGLNDFSMSDMEEDFGPDAPESADLQTATESEEEFSLDDFGIDDSVPEEPEPARAAARGSLAAKAAQVAQNRSYQDQKTEQSVRKTVVVETDSDESLEEPATRRRMPLWARILASILLVALLLAIAFLVFRCVNDRTPPIPTSSVAVLDKPLVSSPEPAAAIATPAPVQPSPAQPAAAAPAATPAAPAPAQTAPAPAAPAAGSSTPPSSAGREPGVWYKVRWGDTLWDLSIAYYRTPWQYMKIFRANPTVIKHPDKIIATTWIYIPK